jgi:hypothetical protein
MLFFGDNDSEHFMQTKKSCLYCNSTKDISDEHVFTEKLGCSKKIRVVCEKCNNEALSRLDTAFLDYSPAVYVNRFRIGHGVPPFIWSVDKELNHLHVEGFYTPDTNALKPFPQLILRNGQFEIRGDASDIEAIGQDRLRTLLVERAHEALDKGNEKKRYQNQQVPTNLLRNPFHFPPRAFTTSIQSLVDGGPLYLRFLGSENEQFMNALRQGKNKGLKNYLVKPGPTQGRFFLPFDTQLLQRAILKFALNFIYYSCRRTDVTFSTFSNVANLVRGIRIPDREARRIGASLICPDSLSRFSTDVNSHHVRLSHLRGHWHFTFSLFGASFGAVAIFPGPSYEDWGTLEHVIPTADGSWQTESWKGALPSHGRFSWELRDLLPQLQLTNYETVKITKGSVKGLRI